MKNNYEYTENYLKSIKSHQINLHHGFAQRVLLENSDNSYFKYPVIGILVVFEQGVNLSIIQAVFHKQNNDGSLGAPASIKSVKFSSL